jgi:hypothetical protein
VDEILWDPSDYDCYTIGYAGDIAILISGKFPRIVSEVIQTTVGIVQQ